MTTLIDTNIVIYLLDENSPHHAWSVDALTKAKEDGPVILPDIAYSELSIGLPSKEATDEAVQKLSLERLPCSDQSFFAAGRAFKKYKDERGGTKNGVLPDFLIGAQAEYHNVPLITYNEKDFKNYFSSLKIICPPS